MASKSTAFNLFAACMVFLWLTLPFPVSGMDGLSFDFKAYILAGLNKVSVNPELNPGNRFARIPEKESILVLKPGMVFSAEDIHLSMRPRFEMSYTDYTIAGVSDSASDDHTDIPEFLVRYKLSESLFLSYSRENLQWGPSFLYSPSNPFFSDNGKKNLVQDLEGKGLFKLVMVHDNEFSTSLIYNSDKGNYDDPDFKPCLALKADYSGNSGYASLILSRTDDKETRLGAFAGTTLTDALIIYTEAGIRKGEKAPDLRMPPAGPGSRAASFRDGHDDIYGSLLLGGVYTLETGDSLCLEYLYYGYEVLGESSRQRPDFQRKNYVMLQYVNDDIFYGIDLVSRAALCLDDGSSRLYSSLSRGISDHLELKLSGMVNTGETDESFRTYLSYQIQMALEYTY